MFNKANSENLMFNSFMYYDANNLKDQKKITVKK